MLYLVSPLGGLQWTGDVGQVVVAQARSERIDLGLRNEWWATAERASDDDDVRVALRYGVAATGGIVVAGEHIAAVRRPRELRELIARSAARIAVLRESPEMRGVDAWKERMAPGSRESSRRLDEDVAAAHAESIDEAQADADRALTLAPDPELLSHWRGLPGAYDPSPL